MVSKSFQFFLRICHPGHRAARASHWARCWLLRTAQSWLYFAPASWKLEVCLHSCIILLSFNWAKFEESVLKVKGRVEQGNFWVPEQLADQSSQEWLNSNWFSWDKAVSGRPVWWRGQLCQFVIFLGVIQCVRTEFKSIARPILQKQLVCRSFVGQWCLDCSPDGRWLMKHDQGLPGWAFRGQITNLAFLDSWPWNFLELSGWLFKF